MKSNQVLNLLSSKRFWIDLFIMTFGMTIAATAVYYFLVPSKLIIGSITGLSIVICNSLSQFFGIDFPLSTMIFGINVILLIIAYLFIGKEFGAKTVYTATILGPIIGILEKYFPYTAYLPEGETSLMGDPWLDLLAFVIILSASQSILFRINASTGGLDIIGKLINKYLNMDIGTSVSIGGAIICCTAFLINPFNLVVLGLIGTWINGLVIDYFTAGMNRKKRVHIITKNPQPVQDYIIHKLHRGCTIYEVTGGYSGEKKIQLEALLSIEEFGKLINYVNINKVDGFITADSVTEVYGLWASKRKQHELTQEEKKKAESPQ